MPHFKENTSLRKAMEYTGVPYWKIAAIMGISEATFTRWLRFELSEEKRDAVLAALEKAKREECL